MKINELKLRSLPEGFIDILVAKAVGRAGGDVLTGFIRSLRGDGAALQKLADGIRAVMVGGYRQQKGQEFSKIEKYKPGPEFMPHFAGLVNLGLEAAEQLSQKETGSSDQGNLESHAEAVSRAQIADVIKNAQTKAAVIAIAGGGVNQMVGEIAKVISEQPPDLNVPFTYDKAIDEIPLVMAAATLIATGKDLDTAAPFKIDPASKNTFEEQGTEIIDLLLTPNTGLEQDEKFIENIKNLIYAQLISAAIRKKYAIMDAAALATLAASAVTPPLISPGTYKKLLSQHNLKIDQGKLDAIIVSLSAAVQAQFKAWLLIAAAEAQTGRKPMQALELYRNFALKVNTALAQSDYSKSEPVVGSTMTSAELLDLLHELLAAPTPDPGLIAALRMALGLPPAPTP